MTTIEEKRDQLLSRLRALAHRWLSGATKALMRGEEVAPLLHFDRLDETPMDVSVLGGCMPQRRSDLSELLIQLATSLHADAFVYGCDSFTIKHGPGGVERVGETLSVAIHWHWDIHGRVGQMILKPYTRDPWVFEPVVTATGGVVDTLVETPESVSEQASMIGVQRLKPEVIH